MILGRLLMRLLLVPLGAVVAICVAVLVVIVAHWTRFVELAATASGSEEMMIALFIAGSWAAFILAVSAAVMLLPAAIGVLIAEAFAIRSWVFHAANGGLSAWIGLGTMVDMREPYDLFYGEPLIVTGAGVAAGLVYWAIAGWSAGFWKPVFASPEASG